MSTTRTITIPANSSIVQHVRGKVFFCIAANGAFTVEADGEMPKRGDAGAGFGSPDAPGFSRLAFVTTSTSDVVVTYYAGDAAYQYTPQTKGLGAYIVPAVSLLAAGGSYTIPNTYQRIGKSVPDRKKAIIIQAVGGTLTLRKAIDDVVLAAAALFDIIPGAPPFYLEATASLFVTNDTAGPVLLNCAVLFHFDA